MLELERVNMDSNSLKCNISSSSHIPILIINFLTKRKQTQLQINNPTQLLNPIQQRITLNNHLSIPSILPIRLHSLNNTPHIINLGSEPSTGDETTELPVQKGRGDTEGCCHGV